MDTLDMTNDIKCMLGFPKIALEIDDTAIAIAIKNALDKARDHIVDYKYVTKPIMGDANVLKPTWSNWVDVSDLSYSSIVDVITGDSLGYPYVYDEFNVINYVRRGQVQQYAAAIS